MAPEGSAGRGTAGRGTAGRGTAGRGTAGRIVVSGYMVRHPLAGNLLAFFHYVLGLHDLGFDVVYLEESGWEMSSYDVVERRQCAYPDRGLATLRALVGEHCPGVPVVYVDRATGSADGMARDELERTLAAADLFVNVGGVCWLPELQLCRRRALVDMDPVFTQLGRFGGGCLADYDTHFTYGLTLDRAGLPTGGVHWLPLVPPVVRRLWGGRALPAPDGEVPFTTVASWDSYGEVSYGGRVYGQKDRELARFAPLARRSPVPLEVALAGPPEASERLAAAGWTVRDAGDVSSTVGSYRDYVRRSAGELSVAKHAYVESRCGWFSDRSACYLAAGLPVVVQDTGVGDRLPVGEGLLTFSTVDEALDCLGRVHADYGRHQAAAAAIAADVCDAGVVLRGLVERALASPPHPRSRGTDHRNPGVPARRTMGLPT